MIFTRAIGLLALLGYVAASGAHDFSASDLRVDHPWAEPAAEAGGVAVVYLRIVNDGTERDTLVAATTTPGLSRTVELQKPAAESAGYETLAEGLAVGGGDSLVFEPGGLRIALQDIGMPLTRGTRFPLFLSFRSAGTLEVEVWVEDENSHAGHDH